MHAEASPSNEPATVGWVELDEAWDRLRPRGVPATPDIVKAYRAARTGAARAAVVTRATRFARDSESVFRLGVEALADRSGPVRERACGLLAYSLRREAVPRLLPLLDHPDPGTTADARAAIAAILSQDHHLFKDRSFTGQVFWIVRPTDLEQLLEKRSRYAGP
jgi:hypothetical protein